MPEIPLTIAQTRAGLQSGFSLDETDQFTFSIPDGDSIWETTVGNYEGSNQQPFDPSYSVFNAAQADAFRAALALWDELIQPNFTEVPDTGTDHGEVRIAFTGVNMVGATAGYAFQGSNQTPTSLVGDVWINANNTATNFAVGTGDWSTLLHELGHVLGLKHPFEPTVIPAPYDDTRYTVMSYTVPYAVVITPTGGGGYGIAVGPVNPLTPSVLDIRAVQDLYGEDTTTRTGDDTYTFNQLDTTFRAIYDAGGTDTIDISSVTRDSTIDLTPGAMSSVGGPWSEAEQIAYYASITGASEADISVFYNDPDPAFVWYDWTDNLGIAFSTTIENVIAGSGNDTLIGNDAVNTLISGAGTDFLNGGAGDDVLYYGAFLSSSDEADGGADRDVVVLQGNYTYTFNDGNLFNVEAVSLQSGSVTRWGDTAGNFYDYNLTTHDDNVGLGVQMIVNGQSLLAGEDLTFTGSAETDGRFLVYGGAGVDDLTGGAGNDVFFFEGNRWSAADRVVGADGRDALVLSAGTGMNLYEFTSASLIGIEAISVNNRFATDPSQVPNYQIVLLDDLTLTDPLILNGNSLDATQTFNVDASAIAGASLWMYGGAGADTLIGGNAQDRLYGGDGADTLTGGGGTDIFRYDAVSHSMPTARDTILDFGALGVIDFIDLSRIDASSITGGDQAFAVIGSAAFAGTGATSAGELRAEDAGGGVWLVQGDTDGNGLADFELTVTVLNADPINAGDFLL